MVAITIDLSRLCRVAPFKHAANLLNTFRIESRGGAKEGVCRKDEVNAFEQLAEVVVVLVRDEEELARLLLDEEFNHRVHELGHHEEAQLEDRHACSHLVGLQVVAQLAVLEELSCDQD